MGWTRSKPSRSTPIRSSFAPMAGTDFARLCVPQPKAAQSIGQKPLRRQSSQSSRMKGRVNCTFSGRSSLGFSRLERDGFLGFLGPTSPPIGEPLADDALRGLCHALAVINAEARTRVVAEIELGKIAMQMGLKYQHLVYQVADRSLPSPRRYLRRDRATHWTVGRLQRYALSGGRRISFEHPSSLRR
jgi:hypothetical protein